MARCSCGKTITNQTDFLCANCKANLQCSQSGFSSPQKSLRKPLSDLTNIPRVTQTPNRFTNYKKRKRGNEPEDTIEGHPQICFVDKKGRTIATIGFPFFNEPIITCDGFTFHIINLRNNMEQMNVSRILNLLSANRWKLIHASHIIRRSGGGSPGRFDTYPVSYYCNISTIGGFERQIEQAMSKPYKFYNGGIDISSEQKVFLQFTKAEFDESIVMPYLCTPETLTKLRSSENVLHHQLAQTIQDIASKIPSRLHQTVYCGSRQHSCIERLWKQPLQPLDLDINKILEGACSPENPLFCYAHLTSKKILEQYENHLKATAKNGSTQQQLFDISEQYGTSEPRGQEKKDIFMFQRIKSVVGITKELEQQLRNYFRNLETQWSYMDYIRANIPNLPPPYQKTENMDVTTVIEALDYLCENPLKDEIRSTATRSLRG